MEHSLAVQRRKSLSEGWNQSQQVVACVLQVNGIKWKEVGTAGRLLEAEGHRDFKDHESDRTIPKKRVGMNSISKIRAGGRTQRSSDKGSFE